VTVSERPDVELRVQGAVATISILRGGTWSWEPAAALAACADRVASDPDVRVAVVEAAGRDFCRGWDVVALVDPVAGRAGGPTATSAAGHIDAEWRRLLAAQADLQCLAELPQPVIAAIGGACLGPGLELAMAADIRIGADDSTFGFPGAASGLPVAAGGDLRLVTEVGAGWAKMLALSARTIDAALARRIGILQQVVPRAELAAAAAELAGQIAGNAPVAVRGIKRTVGFWSGRGLHEALRFEAMSTSVCVVSDDLRAGALAAASGGRPIFEGK